MIDNEVKPNNPAEVQTVRGTIEFKPALIESKACLGRPPAAVSSARSTCRASKKSAWRRRRCTPSAS